MYKTSRKYKPAYRNYYMLQNLVAVRTCSIVFLILNSMLRVFYWILPESLTKAQNFPEFNVANWLYLIVTLFFLMSSNVLIKHLKKEKKTSSIITIYIFAFSVYLISCGIFSSFIATADPSNALMLYMIPLVVISVVCVLEYYETIFLIITIEVIFTAFLFFCHATPAEMINNELISIILLCGFYLMSRYFYIYKDNYYQQVIEIREKNIEIENAGNFKNQVLGMVAHDLRNPIAAVESLAMMMEMDDIDADTRDNLSMIKASCAKARSIISDLLDAARTENSSAFETQKTELNNFIKKVVKTWRYQNERKHNIVFAGTDTPLFANVSNEKFHRVLDNLISNAIKFSTEKEKVEIRLNQVNNKAVIEIEDHGLGIPKHLLPHIFERFSKAGRAGVRGEQSTGLGLSIVRQIIESHKGKIEVDSKENKGSTFKIVLPVVQ